MCVRRHGRRIKRQIIEYDSFGVNESRKRREEKRTKRKEKRREKKKREEKRERGGEKRRALKLTYEVASHIASSSTVMMTPSERVD